MQGLLAMGLEGGSAVANSVPDCLSFVQGPGTVLGKLSRRMGRAATLNFWRGVPWGKAAIADFLAENLPSLPPARAASKGKQGIEKCRKSFKKGAQIGQKWYPGGS